MFDPQTGIVPNSSEFISPADTTGFIGAVDNLKSQNLFQDHNFINNFHKRKEMKSHFIERLNAMPAINYNLSPEIYKRKSETPFILNLKVIGKNSYNLARRFSERNIFVSSTYDKAIPRDPFLRISFQPNTTKDEIDYFISELQSIIKEK